MDTVVGDLEWDEVKRQWTIDNRHLDFASIAQFDLASIETEVDSRRDYGETRYVSTGLLEGRLHVFCWTPRNGRIRIISLRKANDRDLERYQARKSAR